MNRIGTMDLNSNEMDEGEYSAKHISYHAAVPIITLIAILARQVAHEELLGEQLWRLAHSQFDHVACHNSQDFGYELPTLAENAVEEAVQAFQIQIRFSDYYSAHWACKF